ncbi:MAG: hypothetical protein INF52_00655 [Rhodobacter sp.]|nr:hypothetical protein [Rhodobacter sp.]
MNGKPFANVFVVGMLSMLVAIRSASGQESPFGQNYAGPEWAWASVYGEDCLKPVPGKVVSKGPWQVDTNHVEYSMLVGPLIIWTNGYLPGPCKGEKDRKGIPGPLDLSRATLRLGLQITNEKDGGERDFTTSTRLHFFFQTKLPKSEATTSLVRDNIPGHIHMQPPLDRVPERIAVYVFNYDILTDVLHQSRKGKVVSLKLSSDMRDWTCLGRDATDVTRTPPVADTLVSAAKYTCAVSQAEFEKAASAVNVNVGLLSLLNTHDEAGNRIGWLHPKPNKTFAFGKTQFELSEFTLEKRDQ